MILHTKERDTTMTDSKQTCTTERVCAPLGRYWVDGARQVNSGGVYRAVCLACGGRILVKVQA